MQIITEIQIALPTRLQLTLHKGFSTRADQVASFEESGEAVPSDIQAYRRMSMADSQGPVPGQPQFAVLGSNISEYRPAAVDVTE
jgi:hypothetical protein